MRNAVFKSLIVFPIMLGIACAAHAHPHMFFGSTAQFVSDDKGRLDRLRVVFLVDELNTLYTFSELGVNKDGDQKLTQAERGKVADAVMEGFGHYSYFTHLRDNSGTVPLDKPTSITVELQQRRLGLAFVIPLKRPIVLKDNDISLQLYDPTYFTAISIDLPPHLVGGGLKCTVSVIKPSETDQSRNSQFLLSQLSREETPAQENVGAIFAETTRLTCPE